MINKIICVVWIAGAQGYLYMVHFVLVRNQFLAILKWRYGYFFLWFLNTEVAQFKAVAILAELEFHHSRVTLTYFTAKNGSKQFFFIFLWLQKLYRAFRFGTLWPISCSYPRHSQLTRHSLMLANGHIRQSLTAFVNLFFLKVICGLLIVCYLCEGR